jgi:3'-5' exoribonuclease
LEVTENAIHIAKLYKNCNMDILITSALWHDLAKIWDYTWDYNSKTLKHEWMKADYHGKIHHITGSTAEFTAMALKNNVDRNIIQKIQHCIISHHGFNKDFGSPRIPESLEAVILHQADMLSAVHPKHAESPIKYT